MDHPLAGGGSVDLIGNPLNLSATPVTYRHAPPTLGQHTDAVLTEAPRPRPCRIVGAS